MFNACKLNQDGVLWYLASLTTTNLIDLSETDVLNTILKIARFMKKIMSYIAQENLLQDVFKLSHIGMLNSIILKSIQLIRKL